MNVKFECKYTSCRMYLNYNLVTIPFIFLILHIVVRIYCTLIQNLKRSSGSQVHNLVLKIRQQKKWVALKKIDDLKNIGAINIFPAIR